jgi:hypothetical protein
MTVASRSFGGARKVLDAGIGVDGRMLVEEEVVNWVGWMIVEVDASILEEGDWASS